MNHQQCLTRPEYRIAGKFAEVTKDSVVLENELEVISEIVRAYHRAIGHALGSGDSF